MTWAGDWGSAFSIFSRPLTYSRDGLSATVPGFVTTVKQDEVAGDFTSTTCRVTIAAAALEAQNLYPPQQYDRVVLGDNVPRVVSAVHIDYVQNTPLWCRLTVSG